MESDPHNSLGCHRQTHHPSAPGMQCGMVLIVCIVLLAIISILAALSTRNAASTENVSGNVRLTELATQAAETALRHCEEALAEVIAVDGGVTASYPTLGFTMNNIRPIGDQTWETAAAWDSVTAPVYIFPLDRMNQAGLPVTYRRPPECIAGRLQFVLPNGAISTDKVFVVTARGFGPDVPAADPDRRRPEGSEVWLQSHIELQ